MAFSGYHVTSSFLRLSLPVQVVCQIYTNQQAGGGRVDTHVVCGVIQELGSSVTLNVMRVVVSPSELDVYPVLLCSCVVHHVPTIRIYL